MTDFKALCAELLAAADEYAGIFPYMRLDNAMKAARAALAEPVPPDAGEAKTLRELALKELDAWSEERNGPGESIICDGLAVRLIRDALAAEPKPPDTGEVAELVAWLWSMYELAGECNPDEQCRYARAADLLEHLAPEDR